MPLELSVSFSDRAALESELQVNLKHGRAFLKDAVQADVLSDCVLVLVHPEGGALLRLPAQIVMVSASGPMTGTGVELRPFGPAVLQSIEEFVHATAAEPEPARAISEAPMEPPALASQEAQALDAGAALPTERPDAPDATIHPAMSTELAEASEDELLVDSEEPELDEELARELGASKSIPPDVQLQSKQEKLRHLNSAQQVKLARSGEMSDRIALERLYGKQVWEALLHNPRLTVPEVARIARKGTVPKPLIELIIENATWIKAAVVRRALLSNPKVSSDAVMKLLRATPKHELKLIEKGTAYAPPVREAARKLLKQ